MLSSASAGAIVPGGAQAPAETVAIRVLRAFLLHGQRQEPGAIIPGISRRLAVELVQWTKAEIVPDPAPEAPPVPAPEAPSATEPPAEEGPEE